jgi:hypothetical protein
MIGRKILVAAIAGVLLAACSATDSGLLPGSSGRTPSLRTAAATSYAFAPYVDMTAYPPFQFAQGSKQTGTMYFTMAFLVADAKKDCQGEWAGYLLPADDAYVAKQLAAIRARGGDAILSFGGAGHLELAQVCPDAASLAAAYEADLDYYHVTHLDIDIEGPAIYDAASVERRSQALLLLRAHYDALGKPIVISYTLPVLPAGMPTDTLAVVRSAVKASLKIDLVNLMTMDFGDANAPNPQGQMGKYAIAAVKSGAEQLKKIGFPLGTNPYASIGATPMIGLNDTHTEIFEPSDAQTLLAWAQTSGLGRIAFWASQRDKQCKGGVKKYASDTCSSILQTPGEFSKIFASY